ncbi:hypothetical protein K4H28_06025 [Deefgea tanakiae]|uniref:CBM-cenC domain-containing protein n=1 Tax=Deefgea tanakiae TaxID=2865840 RepID=A0ABX8Z8Q6_9NEIS|nr:hypothetical protein [Deefgea tanakiae]QZA78954.1 hypothetical protein K4H28_06025 [Deefgea tanakiae]
MMWRFWLSLIFVANMSLAATLSLKPYQPLSNESLPRFGLNLGGPSYWGAEQLRANIVRNPGFEPLLDRSLVIVDRMDGRQITDRDAWVARPDGFWIGGQFQVLTGAQAGKSGRIRDYRRNAAGPGLFWLDDDLNRVQIGDAISVEKTGKLAGVPQWWPEGRASLVAAASPSGGQYALRLQSSSAQTARVSSYFDTLGGSAGRLLPVIGEWQLSFRVRMPRTGAKLVVRFARDGAEPFVSKSFTPTPDWQTIHLTWQGSEALIAKAAPLSLSLSSEGDGEIWLDDVYLGEAPTQVGGFRRAVVESLKALKPGYLRDWQGQLGDRVLNRFASELVRQPIRYRVGDSESFFAYSIPELFALCAQVQASPWVIGSPTWSAAEWQEFGRMLRVAADQQKLTEVVLEFGNENWNAIFRPAGLTNVNQHREAADRAFAAAKRGFGAGRSLITVVNAPFLWPDSPGPILASTQADRVAVAPYFFYEVQAKDSLQVNRRKALQSQSDVLNKQQQRTVASGKKLAIYEVNFHSTLGNASAKERNQVLTTSISGVALARHLLDATLVGVREQAVYSLAGFSFKLNDGLGDVALFGISRDLSVAQRFRPTGMALAMLNDVAGGQPWRYQCQGDAEVCSQFVVLGFSDTPQSPTRVAIVNATTQSHSVQFPCRVVMQWRMLDGRQSGDNEGEQEKVTELKGQSACRQGLASVQVPAESLLVAK